MHYSKAVEQKLEGAALENHMNEAFKVMQEENADLLEAMNTRR